MIQKVYKGSDLLIELLLKDAEGTPYRVSTTNEFSIKFFTTNPDIFIEGHYSNNEYKGIITDENADYVPLNAVDLEKLEDGVLNYIYTIKTVNTDFEDGFYNEVFKNQTNLYLKSKLNCNGEL